MAERVPQDLRLPGHAVGKYQEETLFSPEGILGAMEKEI